MQVTAYLSRMVDMDASDLYLSTGAPPSFKLHGKLVSLSGSALTKGQVKELAYEIMSAKQIALFEKTLEMNLALSETGLGRFRVNVFIQRNEVSMVIRNIKTDIPSLEALGLPPILTQVIMEKRGLVLFVGATGSGKSTSLASLINYRNETDAGHIISIEEPIEFIHKHKKSIVNQREIGTDTLDYDSALRNTLGQSPDVVFIGEIRSKKTMEHALAFAETGHLCLSTLHANNSNQAFERIISFFPESRHKSLLLDLSFTLKAIVSQRLVPAIDGTRALAVEVLLGTPFILSLVQRGEIHSIKAAMEKYTELGMQTFDQSLEKLFFEKKITLEEALCNADSQNNLRLRIKLHTNSAEEKSDLEEAEEIAKALPYFTLPKAKPKPKNDHFTLADD